MPAGQARYQSASRKSPTSHSIRSTPRLSAALWRAASMASGSMSTAVDGARATQRGRYGQDAGASAQIEHRTVTHVRRRTSARRQRRVEAWCPVPNPRDGSMMIGGEAACSLECPKGARRRSAPPRSPSAHAASVPPSPRPHVLPRNAERRIGRRDRRGGGVTIRWCCEERTPLKRRRRRIGW